MSQSHKPTRVSVCSSATARFAATVDLPTPPLPLATAMTCLIPGIRVAPTPAPAPVGGAWMSIKTLALRTPSMARSACSASFLIVAGTFGSFVARASCTLASPLSILTDLTRPNDTMSRVKPGYFTDFSAFIACSSKVDMSKLTRGLSDVNRRVALAILIVQFVANLIVVSAGCPRRLLVSFSDVVRPLPIGPCAIFRLHWVGRQMKLEDPVFVPGKFQDEQAPRRAVINFDVSRAHTW